MEESLLKAMRSLETGVCHIYHKKFDDWTNDRLLEYIAEPTDDRLYAIAQLIRGGVDLVLIYNRTKIDMFFLEKFKNIVEFERVVEAAPMDIEVLREAKRMGFSDKFIGQLWGVSQHDMYLLREKNGIFPVYKMIDTCASEFELLRALFLLDLRRRERVAGERQGEDRGARFRSDPHRSGRRVRLFRPYTPSGRSAKRAMKPSSSTTTPKPSRPTIPPATSSTSSR